jgi:hypothetical protein
MSASVGSVGHEGKRIHELLGQIDKSASDLAKAAGVTRQSVSKQLGKAKIGKRARVILRRGLTKLEINPAIVWPEDSVKDESEDLRPLLTTMDRRQLAAVKHVLEAHPSAQNRLLFWIDGKLQS